MNIYKKIASIGVSASVFALACAPFVLAQSVTTTTTSSTGTVVPVAIVVPANLPLGMTAAEYTSIETEIQSVLAQLQTLETELGLSGMTGSCYPFSQNLTLGSTGTDVIALQNLLINKGYLQIPAATGYFGSLTQGALEQYQLANNIAPSSYGMVDATTMASLNSCAVPVAVTTTTTTSIPPTTSVTTTTGSNMNSTGVAPVIASLSSSQAQSGNTVTVFGNGFAPIGNTLILTGTGTNTATSTVTIGGLTSSGGGTLMFTVPTALNSMNTNANCSTVSATCVSTGPYNVTLTNGTGTSNSVSFGIE